MYCITPGGAAHTAAASATGRHLGRMTGSRIYDSDNYDSDKHGSDRCGSDEYGFDKYGSDKGRGLSTYARVRASQF